MDFIDVLVKAKNVLHLSDSQIARDIGKSRQWVGVLIHRQQCPSPKSVNIIANAVCKRIDHEITRHAEEVSMLERLRVDLMNGV